MAASLGYAKWGLCRAARGWALTIGGIGILAGCAPTLARSSDKLTAAEKTQIGDLCRSVLKVSARDYAATSACQESLADSLRRERAQTELASLAPNCAAGAAAVAPCVRSAAPPASRPPLGWRNTAQALRDEHRACSELGLDPAAPAFTRCVVSLNSAIYYAQVEHELVW